MQTVSKLLALTLLGLVWLDVAFESQLRQSGAQVVLYVQQYRFALADLFFVLLGDGSYGVVVAVVLARHLTNDRAAVLKSYVNAFACVWATEVLKNYFADPRPYWASEAAAVNCSSGWGNPSGHATLLTGVGFYQAWLLNRSWNKHQYFVWGGVTAFIALVELDRIYLGVHFYSQLVLGTCLGLLVASLTVVLDSHITALVKGGITLKEAGQANLISFSLVLASWGVWTYTTRAWEPAWSDNIQLKCGSKKFAEYSASSSFNNSILVLCPGALVLGFCLLKPSKPRPTWASYVKLCLGAGAGLSLKYFASKWSFPEATLTTVLACYASVIGLVAISNAS
jgi:membrane-associated phospholipid phosphatase